MKNEIRIQIPREKEESRARLLRSSSRLIRNYFPEDIPRNSFFYLSPPFLSRSVKRSEELIARFLRELSSRELAERLTGNFWPIERRVSSSFSLSLSLCVHPQHFSRVREASKIVGIYICWKECFDRVAAAC